jgi:hypothetical protein
MKTGAPKSEFPAILGWCETKDITHSSNLPPNALQDVKPSPLRNVTNDKGSFVLSNCNVTFNISNQ